MCIFLVPL
ncbi:hypothetical protein YPPY54_3590, partial [Yersinia pestis PY-54]